MGVLQRKLYLYLVQHELSCCSEMPYLHVKPLPAVLHEAHDQGQGLELGILEETYGCTRMIQCDDASVLARNLVDSSRLLDRGLQHGE